MTRPASKDLISRRVAEDRARRAWVAGWVAAAATGYDVSGDSVTAEELISALGRDARTVNDLVAQGAERLDAAKLKAVLATIRGKDARRAESKRGVR